MKITRRRFLKKTAALGTGLGLYGFSGTLKDYKKMSNKSIKRQHARCIVLGMDGLDPQILNQLMNENMLPAFARLANQGTFRRLRTSNPAASPVAWSNIATGTVPAYHGIFDFLHRQPEDYMLYLSLRKISNGMLGTKYERARRCDAFWNYTSNAGIPTTVIRWPVTFPAEKVTGRFLSGLAVPDLSGSEGRYFYYTTQIHSENDPSPESVIRVTWDAEGKIKTSLKGPMAGANHSLKLPLVIKKKSSNSVIITIDGSPAVEAHCGRWTGWLKVTFKAWPRRITGIIKFLLVESEPYFKLFAYPVNIDPAGQVFPVTYPAEFGQELEAKIGPFHTLGMPEMVHPVSHKRYGYGEFLAQVKDVSEERKAMFLNELERFDEGLFAFVFDHTDRIQHAFWAATDPQHLHYNRKQAKLYGSVIYDTYKEMDEILSRAIQKLDDKTLLLVVSDHGFAAFNRQVHVNRWLIENGYMHLKGTDNRQAPGLFEEVDWKRTSAYSAGFASIYINVAEREGCGIVKAGSEYSRLCEEISSRLEKTVDTDYGLSFVRKVYNAGKMYSKTPLADNGPDLLVGLEPGYRFSWQTALGAAPLKLIEDNNSAWTGDHIFDPTAMSGILLTNRKIEKQTPQGIDIAPTLLNHFGLEQPALMTGINLL